MQKQESRDCSRFNFGIDRDARSGVWVALFSTTRVQSRVVVHWQARTLECLNSGRDSSEAGQATSELGPRPSLSVTIGIQAKKGAALAAPAAALNKGSLLCLELGRLVTSRRGGCVTESLQSKKREKL